MRVRRLLPTLVALVALLGGCASPPPVDAPEGLDPAKLRTIRGQGFLVRHDGALEASETAELFRELGTSRAAIQRTLGPWLAPGDFRTAEERRAGIACAPWTGDVPVTVLRAGGRCHADETGITLVHGHLPRRDATHELVHFLAGGGWRPIDEGLAVWLTEKIGGAAMGVPVDTRARVYLDLSIGAKLDRERCRGGMSRTDYDLAGSFVKWLAETHGLAKLMELYRAAPGDFMTVYGEGELDLQAKWVAKLRAIDVKQDGDYYRFKAHLTSPSGGGRSGVRRS